MPKPLPLFSAAIMAKPLLILVLVSLTGCSMLGGGRTVVYPPYEGGELAERAPTEKERLLARSNFSVEIVQLTDDRRPRSIVAKPREGVIYEYEPDQLLSGLSYRLPVLFNKHLAYRPAALKAYKVELRVRKLKTLIATGTVLTGSFGRYQVDMEMEALVRRPDSQLVLQNVYKVGLELPRVSETGRSPSKEFDRANMFDLTEDAVRRISEKLGWDIRQQDARRWRIQTPGLPAALHRVTPDAPAPAVPLKEPTILPPSNTEDGTPEKSAPVFVPPFDDSGRS